MKVIVLGATGMVGEGVAHQCCLHPQVEEVLLINRRKSTIQHEKIREILHPDFYDFAPLSGDITGYDACYFCMGVSSVGMSEAAYIRITLDLTTHVARQMLQANPGTMVFTYVSGVGTDSTERGRTMWARVKGKTENTILQMGFKDAYAFRPGYIQPTPGLKNSYRVYRWIAPFYPLWRRLLPSYVVTLEDLGKAMLEVTIAGQEKKIMECRDITAAAKALRANVG